MMNANLHVVVKTKQKRSLSTLWTNCSLSSGFAIFLSVGIGDSYIFSFFFVENIDFVRFFSFSYSKDVTIIRGQ